jgi:hypothetical protein
MFSNGFRNMEMGMGANGVGSFIKKWHCVCVRQTNYSRATTLPRYGTGPSLKSVCFAGSLILYKGSCYLKIMVHATSESGLTPRMGQYISQHIPSRWKTLGFSRHGAGVMLWRRYYQGVPGR